jgi:hypothetical protein
MKTVCVLLALAMLLPAMPVQALDLTIQDDLHGKRVAASKAMKRLEFTDHLVGRAEFNQTIANERKKTSNTIALVTFGLLVLKALTMNSGSDGKKDGHHRY